MLIGSEKGLTFGPAENPPILESILSIKLDDVYLTKVKGFRAEDSGL